MALSNNNQAAFWEAMKEKYEKRNEDLRQQEICLRQRLEQLKQLMENQQTGDDCDCVPEKLEKPSLVQCIVQKGKELILGSCTCGDPKLGQEFLCACHIIDPTVPLNFESNLCPNEPTTSPEGCLNKECDFYNPQLENLPEAPSIFSLKTTDIYYMDKLAELVKTEKCMQNKINELENKERSYITAINDVNELMKKKPKNDPMRKEFDRIVDCLEGENRKLKNELDDLRLELKHCFERVEGPLRRSLENQKEKCVEMEKKLRTFQEKMTNKEDNYLKEINEIKAKLCQACCTMVDLNKVNSRLKNDLVSLENKCISLEDDLVKQQLKEAENILKFKKAICRRKSRSDAFSRGDDSEQDLQNIARKLSETLKEVYPCITKVPTELTDTVKGIKQLTELVGEETQRRKRRNERNQNDPMPSTSQIESFCCCYEIEDSNPESSVSTKNASQTPVQDIVGEKQTQAELEKTPAQNVVETSSKSTAPETPVQDIVSEKQILAEEGKTPVQNIAETGSKLSAPQTPVQDIVGEKQILAELEKTPVQNVVETASKSCICEIEYECRSQQTPSIEKQTSENAVEEAETVCSCDDLQSKMTGPSEEVIAVKDLGTLCPLGVCDDLVKKLKLKVDTTRDIIDGPPEDIHVVTTLAKTGSLEITTEGPPGVLETKVNYLPDGRIEILTKLIDRKKMTAFMDGTLLCVSEQPPETQCNESQTCGGQCDILTFADGQSDVGEGKVTNEMKTSNQLSSSAPYGSVKVNNNCVLLSRIGVDPFKPNEWKNTKFTNDAKEEFNSTSIVFNAKRAQKNKDKVGTDEDLTNEFRLSSRPSLTNIEKHSLHDRDGVSVESLNGFTHPDALDTISEGDEEEDSTRSDSRQNSEHTSEEKQTIDQIFECSNNSDEAIRDTFNARNMSDVDLLKYGDLEEEAYKMVDESGDGSESLTQEDILRESKQSIREEESHSRNWQSSSSSDISDVCDTEIVPDLSIQNSHSSRELLDHEKVSEVPLWCNGNIRTNVRSEEQRSGSFCHLYRNFGNINLLRGNFRLRQTKSLYENKLKGTECLRVCKSAVVNLGTLKIDIEMIKFVPGGPTVGDFDDKKNEDRGKHDNDGVMSPVLEIKDNKEILYPKNDEVTSAESIKEGLKSPDFLEILPEKIYQCYVCSCPNKGDKQDLSESVSSPRNENLEERIDRLLQINPFATSHGPDCQCVDCLIHNAETNLVTSNQPYQGGCKWAKNVHGKSNNASPELHRCECTLENVSLSTRNELKMNNQGDTPQHGENCTCVDCLCNPSNFKMSKSGVACDCKDCKCDTCYDISKNPLADISLFQFAKPPEITVMNVIVPCDCGATCPCDPCLDPNRAPSKTQSQAADNKNSKIGPQTSSGNAQDSSSHDPLNNRETWKNVIGCHCPPLPNNKKEVCDCKVCECKPCGYAEKARKPCDCKQPKEAPKSKEPTGNFKTTPCRCKKICDTGSEIKNRSTSLHNNPSPVNSHLKKCDCEICECVFCSDTDAQKLPENIEETGVYEKPFEKKFVSLLTVQPCDFSKCDCGGKNPNSLENSDESKQTKPTENVILEEKESLTSETCVCPECVSDNCKESIPKSEGMASDEEPSTQADPLQSQSHDSNNQEENVVQNQPVTSDICYCAKCSCNPCKSTPLKPENIPPENESNVEKTLSDVPPEASEKVSPLTSDSENAPSNKQQPGSEVDQAQGDKKNAANKPKIPCDCSKPCPCVPCPDPTIEYESKPPPIGDADMAKDEIMSVLERISCTCNQAENDFKPLRKQASNFESTVSKMKLKLNNLQQKCKDKDQIINAMTKDLRMRSESGVFASLLNELAHPRERFVPDFNRTYVCDFLPRPRAIAGTKVQTRRSCICPYRLEPILELDRYLPGGNDDVCWCRRNLDASGLEILDIRRVTIDSILIKWRSPCNFTGITGYQIFVNDELKYRVLSPNRTSAVLDTLDLSRSLEVMLFAMSTSGRCEPPALATYKI